MKFPKKVGFSETSVIHSTLTHYPGFVDGRFLERGRGGFLGIRFMLW
jgi:hypothetical protein